MEMIFRINQKSYREKNQKELSKQPSKPNERKRKTSEFQSFCFEAISCLLFVTPAHTRSHTHVF